MGAAYTLLEEIRPATLRSICYQLFVQELIAGMDRTSTNRVSDLLTRAREEGEIPWEWIVQEGRAVEAIATWNDPAAFAETVQRAYRRNKWAGQPTRLLVVSEKGTVRGTLAPILREFEVDFLPVGGYASATRVMELAEQADPARPLRLIYLGDHDPSGRHMSDADLPRRLLSYTNLDDIADTKATARSLTDAAVEAELRECGLALERVALIDADLRTLGPRLSFPAATKVRDTRHAWFVRHFGQRCWELDALNPNTLRERVRGAILAGLDRAVWDRYVAAERVERESITQTLATWSVISGLARE